MKKLLLLILFLEIILTGYSQDSVKIAHTNYTTTFSKKLRYPILVEWWETKAKVGCEVPLKRKDQFAADPLLPVESNLLADFVHSGFDRGHLCPAADNLCLGEKVQMECFYFTNMAAQYHSLNAGDWKSLETLTRKLALDYDSIHVWAGNVGVAKKIGNVSVPTQCWKVIYIVRTKEWMAFLFDNNNSHPNGIHDNQVDIKTIQSITKIKFQ
jgi:endonuclease G, mitochondrial